MVPCRNHRMSATTTSRSHTYHMSASNQAHRTHPDASRPTQPPEIAPRSSARGLSTPTNIAPGPFPSADFGAFALAGSDMGWTTLLSLINSEMSMSRTMAYQNHLTDSCKTPSLPPPPQPCHLDTSHSPSTMAEPSHWPLSKASITSTHHPVAPTTLAEQILPPMQNDTSFIHTLLPTSPKTHHNILHPSVCQKLQECQMLAQVETLTLSEYPHFFFPLSHTFRHYLLVSHPNFAYYHTTTPPFFSISLTDTGLRECSRGSIAWRGGTCGCASHMTWTL